MNNCEDIIKLEIVVQIKQFDKNLAERLKGDNFKLEDWEVAYYEILQLNKKKYLDYHETDIHKTVEHNDYNDAAYDQISTAKIIILNKQGDSHIHDTVLWWATNSMNQPIGKHHKDTIHSTQQYIKKMSDGTEKELQHNFIALNMFSQAEILDMWCLENEISKNNGFKRSKNGNKHNKKTTRGWEFLIEWKDSSHNWIYLKEMKDLNPLETAKFIVARDIYTEPFFA